MTDIVIYGVSDATELVNALAAVTRVFTDPSAFDEPGHIFSNADPEDCPAEILEWPEPPPEPLALWPAEILEWPEPPPEPWAPCPDRGTHERLTDCWMCWADVHRGAAIETEVLRVSWDASLARLIEHEEGR